MEHVGKVVYMVEDNYKKIRSMFGMTCGEQFMKEFDDQYQTDDENLEKKGSRLMRTYENATEAERTIINDIFITLCGWSFETLLEMGEKLNK